MKSTKLRLEIENRFNRSGTMIKKKTEHVAWHKNIIESQPHFFAANLNENYK